MHDYESNRVRPKVAAAAGGAGVGGALGTIAVYVIERVGGDIPETVEAAVIIVVAAGLSLAAGYIKSD